MSTAGLVLGSIRFQYLGNKQVKVVDRFPLGAGPLTGKSYYDTYNYDIRWNEGWTIRNLVTAIGWINVNSPWHPILINTYGGDTYKFYFYGIGKIGEN